MAEDQPQENVRVLLDPAGHPFCLCLDEGRPAQAPVTRLLAPPLCAERVEARCFCGRGRGSMCHTRPGRRPIRPRG
ncbi:hypothetical protein [Streptomyces camponoticapitis]|uniref:hypothetical protein n=1 Tax=Streptomyces camponoticapitis TaxID=1616125 RepID=UPI00227AF47F|nr:hypothetical protein [Streptomyces camponoticapitis]